MKTFQFDLSELMVWKGGKIHGAVGLVRPSVGLVRPSVGLVRPLVGLVRPSVGLVRPLVGLVRPSVGLVRPSVGLVRPSEGTSPCHYPMKSLHEGTGRRDLFHEQFTLSDLRNRSQGLVPKIKSSLSSWD